MVTGCNGPELLSPEEQMLMILPSHLELSLIMAARSGVGTTGLANSPPQYSGFIPNFAPAANYATISQGESLKAINTGGESHSFTEVEDFGGGILPVIINGSA